MRIIPPVYHLFQGYEPRIVNGWLTARNDITVPTGFQLCDPDSPSCPGGKGLERIVVSYRTNGNWHGLYTVRDLIDHPFLESEKLMKTPEDETAQPAAEHNNNDAPVQVADLAQQITGDVAERIARRVTKTMLHKMQGKGNGIFDKSYSKWQRNGFMITHNDRLALKFRNYPNVVLLEKTAEAPFEYKTIAEIDGLFDFRHKWRRYLLLVESKSGRPKIGEKHIGEVFDKLRQLSPTSEFGYLVFCTRKELMTHGHLYTRLANIYDELAPRGIGTIFFSFNEDYDTLKRMGAHVATHMRACKEKGFHPASKAYFSDDEIHIYGKGGQPVRSLVRTADGKFEERSVTPITSVL